MDDQTLPSVHHILTEASSEPPSETPRPTYTFRIHEEERQSAEAICAVHNVKLPEFLRACCRALARDYRP